MSLNVESGKFFLALSFWVSFYACVVVTIGVVVIVVIVVVAMNIGEIEKLPMSSHMFHL